MYAPEHFSDPDPARAYALMKQYPFGMVITVADGEPFVSHVPLQIDTARALIHWHLAAANPQTEHLVQGARVKLIFNGPHAYISPTWYAAPNVPTWNYTAIHVTGSVRLMDAHETAQLVGTMSRDYEGPQGLGEFESSPNYQRMLHAIRGFELRIDLLRGKYKLSQNRTPADQRGVVAQLSASNDQSAREVGELMAQTSRIPGDHSVA